MSRVNFSDCFLETSDINWKSLTQPIDIIKAKSEESSYLNIENKMTSVNPDIKNEYMENTYTDINVKFATPRYKIENDFPHSTKTLNEHILDMISLNDNTSEYCMQRNEYLETVLEKLWIKDNKPKNKTAPIKKNNTIKLGKTDKISLNISNEQNNHKKYNRLRCTWLFFSENVETLIDTGASHTFISRDTLNNVPKYLIEKTEKYKSNMLTAAGNLKNNITAKITINTQFCTESGNKLIIPIEYLLAEKLNNWSIIIGESFLGNRSLGINISADYLGLTWDEKFYNIMLYYSKQSQALGYLLNVNDELIPPKTSKLIKLKCSLTNHNKSAITENDPLIHKGFELEPSIINLYKNEWDIVIKNNNNKELKLHNNMNVGLIVEITEQESNIMSISNLVNLIERKSLNYETSINNELITEYNTCLNTYYGDNYEDHVEELVEQRDCFFPEEAENFFQDHLTLLPDTSEPTEKWTFKDVDLSHLDKERQNEILLVLGNFSDCFAKDKFDVGVTNLLEAHIKVNKKHKSFKSQKQRFLEPHKLKVAQEAADVLLKSGVIRISESPVLKSNLCLVPRVVAGNIRDSSIASKINSRKLGVKTEESWRVCVDLRNLNDSAIGVSAPALLTLDHILEKLNNKIISNVDLSNGYHHIRLTPRSSPLTAFYLGDKIMEFTRLSMGYSDAPRLFVLFMQKIFSKEAFEECWNELSEDDKNILSAISSFDDIIISYMDDLWIFSDPKDDLRGHLPVIRLTFAALRRAGVLLGPKKCTFYTQEFKVLGVNVNSKNSELYLNEKKANAILLWTRPNSLSELQSRIFSLNYWEKFIPRLRDIISPWFLLLRSKEFIWDKHCEEAFHQLKSVLLADVRLSIPQRDSQLIMTTDASKISTSQILFIREKNGTLKIAGCNSRIFSPSDSRRDANFKEACSLATGFKAYGSYLSMSSKPPIILCDARNLMYIARMRERSILAQNLNSYLYEMSKLYNFQIFMIPGSINYLADIFSRSFSKSKYVCSDKYNLSKEAAENLPKIKIPFEMNAKILQTYLKSEILPEKNDFGNRDKNLPRAIEPILTLYMNRTGEERYVDAMILLKQIAKKVNSKTIKSIVKADDLDTTFNLTELEIKNLLNYDSSKGKDATQVKFLKPIMEKIVEKHFGPEIDIKHKQNVRDALLLNYIKMRKLDFNSENMKIIYNSINTNIVEEINKSIKSQFIKHGKKENELKTSNNTILTSLNNILSDDGQLITINHTYTINTIWEHNDHSNNSLFQEMESTNKLDEETDTMDLLSSKCGLNNNLLHAGIDKLDKLEIFPQNVIKVKKDAIKQDIYYTCSGMYPPSSSPYGFDAGIDLTIQEQITLKPNKDYKINTGLSFLLNSTTMGTIWPKSRIMGKLTIFPGVIDSNYTGPIILGVKNITTDDITFEAGKSFAQLCITEINLPNLIKCDKIIYEQAGPARNNQGFGSSGNNMELNLIEQNLTFLNVLGLQIKEPLKILHNTTISDLFADSLEKIKETPIPLVGRHRDRQEEKDQLNSWRYLRGEILNKTPEERQNIVNQYLNTQVLKQACLYGDIMSGDRFDTTCLSRLQLADEFYGSIYNKVNKNNEEERYVIIKELLYKKYPDKLALCVPTILLIGLTRILHERLLHGSKNQTFNCFTKYFHHPMAKKFITKYIKSCLTCRCTDIPSIKLNKGVMERTYEAKAAREVLSFDLIPNLPPSEGKNAVLIVIDDFSGYIILIGLKSMEANKIEESLLGVFTTIGFPKICRTDCDRRIVNALNKLQLKIPFIICTSSPYTHEQNGKAEQGVKMFKHMSRKILYDPNRNLNKNDWFKLLPIISKTINNLPLNNSTLTREEIFFKSSANNIFSLAGAEKIFSFIEQDDKIIEKYIKILKDKRETDKNKNKSKIKHIRISAGDIVVFLNETTQPTGVSSAFQPNGYLNIFQVLRKFKPSSTIEILNLRTGTIHTTDLKKVRKIQINEFVSELTADQYFRNLPDFSKFSKPGILEINEPLLDSNPLKTKRTNLSILDKEITESDYKSDQTDDLALLPVGATSKTNKTNLKLNRRSETTDLGTELRELNLRTRKVQFQT